MKHGDDELDSDEDPDMFATAADVANAPWIEQVIKDEPAEKIYVRSEDFRVGGYRYAPLKLIKSFQKQRIAGTKW